MALVKVRFLAVGLVFALAACSSEVPGCNSPIASVPVVPSAGPSTVPSADASTSLSPSATPASVPLSGRVIVIDPGHNGRYDEAFNTKSVPAGHGLTKACNTSGTATDDGWPEHAYNWAQAQALTSQLEALGAVVVLTRPDDDGLGPCVNDRAAVANDSGAALLISIHADGNTSSTARGFHVIYSTQMDAGAGVEEASAALATDVRDALDGVGMPRSTYVGGGTALSPRDDLGTLNLLTVPGVMIEMGNMRDPDDAALLASPVFQASVAKALAGACVKTLGG